MMPPTKSKAFQGAYNKGMRAAMDCRPCVCPYKPYSQVTAAFRRFWLQGYNDGLWARGISDAFQSAVEGMRAFEEVLRRAAK